MAVKVRLVSLVMGFLLFPWAAHAGPLILTSTSSIPASFSSFTINFSDANGNGILNPGEVTSFSGISVSAQSFSVLAAIPDILGISSASASNPCGSGTAAWCFSSPSSVLFSASAGLFSYQITSPAPPPVTPVAGTLNLTGNFSFNLSGIDFILPVGPPGGAISVSPSTGSFAPLNGTSGIVKDLSFSSQPIGTPFLLQQFITFASDANTELDLTEIAPGVGTLAECTNASSTGTCTPSGTPYNFVNTGPNSSALSFDFSGLAINLATGDASPFEGEFSTQFAGFKFQDLYVILSAGGSVTTAFSGSIAASAPVGVPEPATLVLLGLGVAGLGFSRRRMLRN